MKSAFGVVVALVALAGCAAQKAVDAGHAPITARPRAFSGTAGPQEPLGANVDENGGTFSTLYFAVVGDTRPAQFDDTASYPTSSITRIYQDIAALSPAPEFVVATGDYMFAHNDTGEGKKQMELYKSASSQWKGGPLFAVMGNHECDTMTATNCAGGMATTANLQVYEAALVEPLHKQKPYYAVRFTAVDDPGLSVKLVVTACNAWDHAQKSFFDTTLADQSTYTIVVRHEPAGETSAPCVTDEDDAMMKHPIDLLITGHIHTFEHEKNEIIVGNGGAPASSSQPFGFATVELVAGTGFRVVQYDAASAAPIDAFMVPGPA